MYLTQGFAAHLLEKKSPVKEKALHTKKISITDKLQPITFTISAKIRTFAAENDAAQDYTHDSHHGGSVADKSMFLYLVDRGEKSHGGRVKLKFRLERQSQHRLYVLTVKNKKLGAAESATPFQLSTFNLPIYGNSKFQAETATVAPVVAAEIGIDRRLNADVVVQIEAIASLGNKLEPVVRFTLVFILHAETSEYAALLEIVAGRA